ncbi:signal peptidase I [Priestia taiwanensis]|uniref:Signal peptidase I n=1 Tax=Priestia taiwanensis TaxID=1347902 RepID=A0A917APY4_9BACI|nr:signal peptidase I [Priestia taiwanensis]MBM7362861.1 signal peptidase I [Priestia taiwanensis]GGE65745.1 signal peptidase I [Priestia taiwanensis]
MSKMWEWIKVAIIAFLTVVLIRTFLWAPILVDGVSMMPTLHNENRVIVDKLSYQFGEPNRFDIIVFRATENKNYIKRVIGLPGDHIAYKSDTLYLNGEPCDEPYLAEYKKKQSNGSFTSDFTLEHLPGGYKVVPEGHLFVLGDNRRFSKDSRTIGVIPMDVVIGGVDVIYWPLDEVGIVK